MPEGDEADPGPATPERPSGPSSRLRRADSEPDAGPAAERVDPPARRPTPAGPPAPTRWYRRRPALVAGGVVVVLLAGLVWVVVTGLMARDRLDQARSEASALRTAVAAGDLDRADLDARVARIAADARRAHQLTTGPAWAVTAVLPWVGAPAQVTRGLTREIDQLASSSLPAVGRVADEVAGGRVREGSRVDLDTLVRLTPDVRTAAGGFRAARAELDALPSSTWFGPVDRARDQVAGQVDQLASALGGADTALQVLPTMLGGTGPQRYFVAFENNAEARGTGGLPGAFAIVTVTDGTVTFERFEPDDALVYPAANRVDVTGQVNFGSEQADYLAQYGYDLPFGDYRQTNESPHFPYAAQIWAAMWKKYSGETVTGAVAVDPTALSYLLKATGPVTLPDGSRVTSDTIVSLTQRDVYAKFPGTDDATIAARKAYLLELASRTEKALLASGTDTATLLQGAARAASERRLLVWSADPAVEAVLAGSAVGGALPETTQPFGLLTVLNVAGTKLDYYLDRTVTWRRSGCGSMRDVTVRITVRNSAPASGLPPFVTFRADDPPAGTPVGSNRWVLDWYATSGALLQDVSVDGTPVGAQTYEQRGHPVFRTLLETAPGASHTVVLHLREPAGTAPVTLLSQPLVRPLDQSAFDAGC